MSESSVGTDRPRAEDVRILDVGLRRPRETEGATSRSVSPRLAGNDTRCSNASSPRETEVAAEPVPNPDGGGAVVADGNPPPDGACGRKGLADGNVAACGSQGGSIVFDNDGEGVAERQGGAEGGVSAGAAGGTLESAGSSPSTSAGYVKVSETSSRADLLGEGTPSRSGIGPQCSWGMHTAGRVEGCLMKPRYEVPLI